MKKKAKIGKFTYEMTQCRNIFKIKGEGNTWENVSEDSMLDRKTHHNFKEWGDLVVGLRTRSSYEGSFYVYTYEGETENLEMAKEYLYSIKY